MKRLLPAHFPRTLATVVLLAVASGCASLPGAGAVHHPIGSPEENEMIEEIHALLQTYQRGLNEGDVALIRSIYSEDAVFIGQPFPTTTGVEAIAALYTDFLSKLDFHVQFEILEVQLDGHLGFARTRSTGTISPKGQPAQGSEGNRELFVLKRLAGAWKVYRYIFNAEVGSP